MTFLRQLTNIHGILVNPTQILSEKEYTFVSYHIVRDLNLRQMTL